MSVAEGCALEIVTDTTAARTNSAAEKTNRMHVCSCACRREHRRVCMCGHDSDGWKRMRGGRRQRHTVQRETERWRTAKQLQPVSRFDERWEFLICTKWLRSPHRAMVTRQAERKFISVCNTATAWARGIAPKRITAMLCAHERACFVLAPQMDCTFRTGGTSLLFLKREIRWSGEGRAGGGGTQARQQR